MTARMLSDLTSLDGDQPHVVSFNHSAHSLGRYLKENHQHPLIEPRGVTHHVILQAGAVLCNTTTSHSLTAAFNGKKMPCPIKQREETHRKGHLISMKAPPPLRSQAPCPLRATTLSQGKTHECLPQPSTGPEPRLSPRRAPGPRGHDSADTRWHQKAPATLDRNYTLGLAAFQMVHGAGCQGLPPLTVCVLWHGFP